MIALWSILRTIYHHQVDFRPIGDMVYSESNTFYYETSKKRKICERKLERK